MTLHCQLKSTIKMYRNSVRLRFVFLMKYGKHLVSTIAIDQLNTYFRNFAGYLTCNYNFRGYKRPRKLKTANIYPHVFEVKTRKFGDAKIFHFTVFISGRGLAISSAKEGKSRFIYNFVKS